MGAQREPEGDTGQGEGEHETHTRRRDGADRPNPQSDAARRFARFEHAAKPEFRSLDGFVRRRLRAILRKQEKRPGFGRCADDHQQWPNAFFANLGLFTLEAAWDQARRSR